MSNLLFFNQVNLSFRIVRNRDAERRKDEKDKEGKEKKEEQKEAKEKKEEKEKNDKK